MQNKHIMKTIRFDDTLYKQLITAVSRYSLRIGQFVDVSTFIRMSVENEIKHLENLEKMENTHDH